MGERGRVSERQVVEHVNEEESEGCIVRGDAGQGGHAMLLLSRWNSLLQSQQVSKRQMEQPLAIPEHLSQTPGSVIPDPVGPNQCATAPCTPPAP
eukprot:1537924-Rhodomonas_salina.1